MGVVSYSVAVDIGGTFTDIVLKSSDGRFWVDKTLTTHKNLLEGFFRGVSQVLGKAGVSPEDVNDSIVHATTTITNALIERKGARTALIVTDGFADVLLIRNEHRYDIYDLQIEFADPLVPRELTFALKERTLAGGSVATAVDKGEVVQIAKRLQQEGVTSVAVCLLNSYRNGANEREVAAILKQELPGLYVSISSEIAPQIREYLRTSTTAINAYTVPIAQPYLEALSRKLVEEGFAHAPLIMLSSGGVIGAETAGRNPVRMIESGPAAGALAASFFAGRLGEDRLLAFDMGGTTAKACLIEGGKPLVTGSLEVDRRYRFKEGSGMPVAIPAIDLIEIGAGGGSIAHVDALGLLKVGPQSAGSEPGPACYDRGGDRPTVTDADLVLGMLDADNFLGGEMKLNKAAAERALGSLGEKLKTNTIEAARGVYKIVAEAMASATRAHAIDRGVDHRGMPLLAFGGAGPVHACEVAKLLQSPAVIFPPNASVLSAFGTLVTAARLDLVRSSICRADKLDWEQVASLCQEMTDEAIAALKQAGRNVADIRLNFGADMRYRGQQHEVSVSFPVDPRTERNWEKIVAPFENAYTALYGIAPAHVPVEIVTWRLVAQTDAPVVAPTPLDKKQDAAPRTHRAVHLWADAQPVAVYDRQALSIGQEVFGPALIEERETTIVISPGWRATTDKNNCIIATKE